MNQDERARKPANCRQKARLLLSTEQPGNAAFIRTLLELASHLQRVRSQTSFSDVRESLVQTTEVLQRVQNDSHCLGRSTEVCVSVLSALFFSVAVVLERLVDSRTALADTLIRTLSTAFSVQSAPLDEQVVDASVPQLEAALWRRFESLPLNMVSGSSPQVWKHTTGTCSQVFTEPAQVTLRCVVSWARARTDQTRGIEAPVAREPSTQELSLESGMFGNGSSTFNENLKSLSSRKVTLETGRLDHENFALDDDLSSPLASQIHSHVADASGEPKRLAQLDLPEQHDNAGGVLIPDTVVRTRNPSPPNNDSMQHASDSNGQSSHVDRLWAVAHDNQRKLEPKQNACPVIREAAEANAAFKEATCLKGGPRAHRRLTAGCRHCFPCAVLSEALKRAGRGAISCILLFLLELSRSRAQWQQRSSAIRLLHRFIAFLPQDELRQCLPGISSGLCSVIAGDAQTRALVLAEAATCFGTLFARALEPSLGTEVTGSMTAPASVTSGCNWQQTKSAVGIVSPEHASPVPSKADTKHWIHAVAPKLQALLNRILVENCNAFSLHHHPSALVQAAGVYLCTVVLESIRMQDAFADDVPMLFANLALYLTSEHHQVAVLAARALRFIEALYDSVLAERALDGIGEDLGEFSDDPERPWHRRRMRCAAGLLVYLGQCQRASALPRLVQYLYERRNILDLLLAIHDSEARAGPASPGVWILEAASEGAPPNARLFPGERCDLVQLLGYAGAMDPLLDPMLGRLDSRKSDAQAQHLQSLLSFANNLLQGSLSREHPDASQAVSNRSNGDDLLSVYLEIGEESRHDPATLIQILRGIRVYAAWAARDVVDFRRRCLHKYMAFVASVSLPVATSASQMTAPVEDKIPRNASLAADSELEPGSGSAADTNALATAASQTLQVLATAAGFASVESLVRAQLSFLIRVVSTESARRFFFSIAGPESLVLVSDELVDIGRGIAFLSEERALRNLELLDTVCAVLGRHPCLRSDSEHRADADDVEEDPSLLRLAQVVESVGSAALAATERQSPELRRAALQLLHGLLESLASNQRLLLPMVARVLDHVPRCMLQTRADVRIAACDVIELAFILVPWFASSRTDKIWATMSRLLPQPLRTNARRRESPGTACEHEPLQLVRGITWATITRVLQCLCKIPVNSLRKHEQAIRAQCSAIQRFTSRSISVQAQSDFALALSAAQQLVSILAAQYPEAEA